MEYRAYRAINSDKRIPSGRRALNVRERIVCQRTMLTMVATLLLLLAYVCHVRYVCLRPAFRCIRAAGRKEEYFSSRPYERRDETM